MRRFIIIAFLCLMVSKVSMGQVDAPKDIQKQSVQGKVVDAKSGQPIRKVKVEVAGEAGQSEERYSATTSEDGTFAISDLKPGRYNVSLDRAGYVGTTARYRQGWFTLQSGQSLSGLVFKLQAAAVISGKIVDMDGDPMASVGVQAKLEGAAGRIGERSGLEFGQTNDLGEYRIVNLRPGKYLVSASPPERFSAQGHIDHNGKPNERLLYAQTYYPGTLDKSQAVAVEVHSGEEMSANFGVLMTQAYRVSGNVAGVPNGAMAVIILEATGGGARFAAPPEQLKDGNRFEFEDVLPGSYVATISVFKGVFSGRPEHQTQRLNPPIEVNDTDVEGVQLRAELPGQVRGTFRLDTGEKFDWSHVQVMLQPVELNSPNLLEGMLGSNISAVWPQAVNRDGSFEIKDVPGGGYRLEFGANLDSLRDSYTKSVILGGRDVVDSGFDVNGDVYLDVLVSAKGATIEGNVMDEKGQLVPYGIVAVVPNLEHRARSYQQTTTDEHGHFIARGMTPGSYSVLAFEDLQELVWEPEFLKTYSGKGEKVELKEGDKKTLTLKVIPAEREAP